MVRAAASVDPVTLVAAYHTAYNVVGVALLLPLIGPFTRLIERIVPERSSPFTRSLDPAALAGAPTVAIEAVRRTVARVLEALCARAAAGSKGDVREASAALHQANNFLSKVTGPLADEEEQRWFISTVHALDHAARLAETIEASARIEAALDSSDDERRAVKLHAEAMRSAAAVAAPLVSGAAPVEPSGEGVERLERCSDALGRLQLEHRRATLDSVASGSLTASDAIVHAEAVRLLDQQAHHAWRAAAHLAGAIAEDRGDAG
jgi:phosphate:Na+ symporter